MDIRQLRYFIAIVKNDFNISKASRILYISQPALSMMLTEFENKENIKLFKRSKGKIIGLSYVGERYYNDAKEVIRKYNEMYSKLHNTTKEISGNISIGIPPLVLSVAFSKIMPQLILDNPKVKFTIREQGAYALRNELLLNNIQIAILLSPVGIPKRVVDSFEMLKSELALFISPHHHLAQKEKITWQDLHKEKMAIFDDTFMIYHQLIEVFERHNVYPHLILKSSSWDFLLNSVKINKELLTILPFPISDQYQSTDFICRKIEEPIPWIVTVCRLKKSNYSNIENYIFDSLVE